MKPPRLSLKKREILRGYQAFSRVIAEGQSLQKGPVRCFFAAASGRPGLLRVGFSVSRSVRNAADRNRARRWLKEAYRRNRHILVNPATARSEPTDVVFMVRVRDRLLRSAGSHATFDQAIIALLKELCQHLSYKQ